jgi:hypothetical protein
MSWIVYELWLCICREQAMCVESYREYIASVNAAEAMVSFE